MADEINQNIVADSGTETPAPEAKATEAAAAQVDDKKTNDIPPGVQKRIDKLTRRMHEREEAHKREMAELRQSMSKPVQKPVDEMSDDEIIDAKVAKKIEEQRQADQQRSAQVAYAKEIETNLAQVTKHGTEKFSDYDEVVASNEDVTLPLEVIPYIAKQGELGASLLYEIGKHPEYAETINYLVQTNNEVDLKLFLNDLKNEVKSKYPAGAKKKKDKANEPLLPVRGNSSAPNQPRPEASAQEHREFFKRQREEQRKSRTR